MPIKAIYPHSRVSESLSLLAPEPSTLRCLCWILLTLANPVASDSFLVLSESSRNPSSALCPYHLSLFCLTVTDIQYTWGDNAHAPGMCHQRDTPWQPTPRWRNGARPGPRIPLVCVLLVSPDGTQAIMVSYSVA